jgi:hypothetical protein
VDTERGGFHTPVTTAFVIVLAFVAAILAAACGDPPSKEISQAQGAIDAARAAGAAEYASEEFRAAEESLGKSLQFVDERDYRQALSVALDARERAQTAARQAADEKARVRTDADRLLRTSETNLQQVRAHMDAAVAARVTHAALADPRKTLDAASSSVAQARAAFGFFRDRRSDLYDVLLGRRGPRPA